MSRNKLKHIAHVYMGVSPRDLKPSKEGAALPVAKQSKGQRECWAVTLACLDHDTGLIVSGKMERATIKETLVTERSEQRPSYNLGINDILISNRGNYRVVGPIMPEHRYGVKEDATMPWVPSMTIVLVRMRKEYEAHAERLAWFLGSEGTKKALFGRLKPAKNGQLVLTKDKLEELELPDKFLDFDIRYFAGLRDRMNEGIQLRRRIAEMRADRTSKAIWRNLENPASYDFDSWDKDLPSALGCSDEVSPETIVKLYGEAGMVPPVFTDKFLGWAKRHLNGRKLMEALGPGHYISRKLARAAAVQALGLDQACPSLVRFLAEFAKDSAHVGMIGEVSGELLSTMALLAKRDGEMTNLAMWSENGSQMKVAAERVRFSNPDVRVEVSGGPRLYLSEKPETGYYHAVFALLSDSSASDFERPIKGVMWQDAMNLVRKNGMLVVLGDPSDIWKLGLKSNATLAQYLDVIVQLPGALFGSRISQKVMAVFRHAASKDDVRIIDVTGASFPGAPEMLPESIRTNILQQMDEGKGPFVEAPVRRTKIQRYSSWPGVLELMGRSGDLISYTAESLGEELCWREARLEELKQREDEEAVRVIPPDIVTPPPTKPNGWK